MVLEKVSLLELVRPICYTTRMEQEYRKRLVVLGVDGLPLSLAKQLAASGRFPALTKLIPQARAIRAELPELSPVNWTSFYTGAGPEEHGIFGFTRIHSHTYEMGLCDFTHVQVPTIFDCLGKKGLLSRVINLPNTYPARDISGMLIAGFVAPELAGAVHPPYLLGPVSETGYVLEADTTRGIAEPEFLLGELRKTLASRRAALSLFWPDLAWDLFTVVLTETDRLFHFFFDAVVDPSHLWHAACVELLVEWDALIGEVFERFDALPEPKRLICLADHGFGRLITEVDLNAWLREQGLLRTSLPPEACDELDATTITTGTKAFALDPGRIYIHSSQRFAKGTVASEDVPMLTEQIRQALLRVTYNGNPVFAAVHTAAEMYDGPLRHVAPDLVCEPVAGFDCKAKFNRREVFGFYGRTGTHTVGDTFFYDSEDAAPAEGYSSLLYAGAGLPSVDGNQGVQRVRDVGKAVCEYFACED